MDKHQNAPSLPNAWKTGSARSVTTPEAMWKANVKVERETISPTLDQHAEEHHREPEPGQAKPGDHTQFGLREAELGRPRAEDGTSG